jgi:hypothetical protein
VILVVRRELTLISQVCHECDVFFVLGISSAAGGIHKGLDDMWTTASAESFPKEAAHMLRERRSAFHVLKRLTKKMGTWKRGVTAYKEFTLKIVSNDCCPNKESEVRTCTP